MSRFALMVARWLVPLVLVAARVLAAGSREVQYAPPPAWVEAHDVPQQVSAPEESVGRHYLLVESQQNVAEAASYFHNAYRVLTAAGVADGSQVNLSFDPAYQTLTLHHVRVIRDGVVNDRLDRTKVQVIQREQDLDELLYNGDLSALLILDDVRVGDIVDVAFTRTGANPVFRGHFITKLVLDWGLPVTRLRHRLLVPAGRTLAHRVVGRLPAQVHETIADDGRTLLWEGKDLPATVADSHIPEWYETMAFINVSDFPNWEAVAAWALPLYEMESPCAENLRAKAAELKASAADPAGQALHALEFVQHEIRYLGVEQGASSHQPSAPEAVLSRRFGDCKDKARLLVTLLREMGIPAAPVLVHSTRKQALADWLPSPSAFDHVVAQIEIGGKTFVVDPTLNYQAGDLAHHHTTRYRTGLVVRAGTTDLTLWPESDNDRWASRVDETITLGAFGDPAKFHVHTTYSARWAEQMRGTLAQSNRDSLAKDYVNFYARYFPDISVAQRVDWSDNPNRNEVAVDEYYSIPNFFTRTESGQWKADVSVSALDTYTSSPGAGGRKAPLALSYPVDVVSHTTLTLPEPWSIEASNKEVVAPEFKLTRTSRGKGNEIEYVYEWTSKSDHVSVDGFARYARSLAQAKALLGSQLTYTPAATPPVAAKTDRSFHMNWGMLALACVTLGACIHTGVMTWRLPAPTRDVAEVEATPHPLEGISGWLYLVAFGVIVRPIGLLVTIYPMLGSFFNLTTWRLLTDPTSPGYNRPYAFVVPLELMINIAQLTAALVMVPLFFRRRAIFPRVAVIFFGFITAATLFECWAATALQLDAAAVQKTYGTAGQTILAAVIWIPYFLVSRRVKATFVR